MNKKRFFLLMTICFGLGITVTGCEKSYVMLDDLVREEEEKQKQESDSEEGLALQFLTQEDSDAAVLEMQYADREPYPALAEFLTEYFDVPQELLGETRYYYCRTDIDGDGTLEIAAVVLNEELEDSSGYPLLLLREDGETFTVLDELDHIHTPVVIDDECTDGWHNVIPTVHGGGMSPGYLIYRYDGTHYSTDEETDFVEQLNGKSGVQILSDNFIDDLDRGDYLTLLPEETEQE